MATGAERRAKTAYKRKVRQVTLQFYPGNSRDDAILAHIKSQPKINAYLKALVERDITLKNDAISRTNVIPRELM